MNDIEREEFEAWKLSPVTRWVMDALHIEAEAARDQFLSRFFYGPDTDPYEMAMLRGQYLALTSVSLDELSFERIIADHDDIDVEPMGPPTLWGETQQ